MATARKQTSSLWRMKPIELIMRQSDDQQHGLKRTLTAFTITLLGVGAIVGIGIFVAVVAGLTPIDVVAELTNIGTLAAFVLVAAGVLILRRTQPNLRRGYRVPWVPFIPILSIIASFVLIVSLPLVTILRFIIWLALGLVIYFLYSRYQSKLEQHIEEHESETQEERAGRSA